MIKILVDMLALFLGVVRSSKIACAGHNGETIAYLVVVFTQLSNWHMVQWTADSTQISGIFQRTEWTGRSSDGGPQSELSGHSLGFLDGGALLLLPNQRLWKTGHIVVH